MPWLTVLIIMNLRRFRSFPLRPEFRPIPPLKPGCWYARLPVTHALADDDDEKIKQGHLGRGMKKPLLTCYLVWVRRLWWWQRQPNDCPIKWVLLYLFNLFAHLIWLLFLCMESSSHPASKMSTKARHFFCQAQPAARNSHVFQFIVVHNKVQSAIKGTNKKTSNSTSLHLILGVTCIWQRKIRPHHPKRTNKTHIIFHLLTIPQLPTHPKIWTSRVSSPRPEMAKKHLPLKKNRSSPTVKICRFCPKRERESI